MIPPGLVAQTASQLEEMAITDLRRRPDIDFRPPINVEALIELMPDVELQLEFNLKADFKAEGMVGKESPFSKKIIVKVDYGVFIGPWADYNVVLAEEYAHLRIHPALFLYVTSPEDFLELQRDPEWPRFESDARRFSLAIRLPPALFVPEVEHAYSRVVDEHGFGDAARIESLMRGVLAERFKVPTRDVQRRMSNYPCDMRDRLSKSVASRSPLLLPESWTVCPMPPKAQVPLFGNW